MGRRGRSPRVSAEKKLLGTQGGMFFSEEVCRWQSSRLIYEGFRSYQNVHQRKTSSFLFSFIFFSPGHVDQGKKFLHSNIVMFFHLLKLKLLNY